MTTVEADVCRALIAHRYTPGRWAFLRAVADSTGEPRSRVADAVAVSLWPSDGLELHLVEVKASRADALREFRTPEKAAAVGAYCHRWWLACRAGEGPGPDEVPEPWGLYVVAPSGAVGALVRAPLRDPLPPGPQFVAALVRAAQVSPGRRASSVGWGAPS